MAYYKFVCTSDIFTKMNLILLNVEYYKEVKPDLHFQQTKYLKGYWNLNLKSSETLADSYCKEYNDILIGISANEDNFGTDLWDICCEIYYSIVS